MLLSLLPAVQGRWQARRFEANRYCILDSQPCCHGLAGDCFIAGLH